MTILVSGSSGLVGRALLERLEARGDRCVVLSRRSAPVAGRESVAWNPAAGTIDAEALATIGPIDAVVHLAGENIADGRWTAAKKARIRDSRVVGTRVLANALAALAAPPRAFVSASAIGYYGDRGDEVLTESSSPGTGFLPDVCREWESASEVLDSTGCRRVLVRIGVVLARDGGALAKMLLPFKLGLGGKVGSGRQYMSWITLDDLVAIFLRAVDDERVSGPVNAVAPEAVTNAEFTKALGGVLSRPTFVPLPGFAARIAFGELAQDLLLASTRVDPARLRELGHEFAHARLEDGLRAVIGG